MLFSAFAGFAGLSSQWSILTEERFILRTLSGDVHPIADALELLGVPAPKTKANMLRFLQGDALQGSPIKGDKAPAWTLFCKAAAAALQGDRTLCDTYAQDVDTAIVAIKAARADKRKSNKPAPKAAASVPAAGAASVPAADPIGDALTLIGAAVNAGTLTDAQCAELRAMVERLALPA